MIHQCASGTNNFIVTPGSLDPVTGDFSTFTGQHHNGLLTAGQGPSCFRDSAGDLTVSANFNETAAVPESTSSPRRQLLRPRLFFQLPALIRSREPSGVLTSFGVYRIGSDNDSTNDLLYRVCFSGISCNIVPIDPTPFDGFVATSQGVTGGILGTNPLLTDGLNALLASNLTNFPFLLEVADLDDPTYTNDPEITLNTYGGMDVDGDPTNNNDGANEFVIDSESYDDNGNIVSQFPGGDIVNNLLTAGPGTIVISGIPLNDLTVAATFSETTPGSGIFEFTSTPTAAFLTETFLVTLPAPDPFTGTLVDVLTSFGIFPDIDTDDGTNESYSAEFVFTGISCVLYGNDFGPGGPTPTEDCGNGIDDDGDSLAD